MYIDPDNPVVALCAAGMEVEGDDYDASIAAHFLARHQATVAETIDWNERALHHATRVTNGRASEFLASLYLNVGDSYLAAGRFADADVAVERARANLDALPAGGYRNFVEYGIRGLADRVAAARRGSDETDVGSHVNHA